MFAFNVCHDSFVMKMCVCVPFMETQRHRDTEAISEGEEELIAYMCDVYRHMHVRCIMHVMYIGVICIELYINASIVLVPVLCID